MHPLIPNLWFDTQAEEAAEFYVSVFPNSRILTVARTPVDTPGPKAGDVVTVEFELGGARFVGINGGPHFQFTEAISFAITCDTQEEIDHYWSALTADGGEESQCGWLKDKYGLSWQVVPSRLGELMSSSDPAAAQRVGEVMMSSVKFDIAELEAAARG